METKAEKLMLSALRNAFPEITTDVESDYSISITHDLRRQIDIFIQDKAFGIIIFEVKGFTPEKLKVSKKKLSVSDLWVVSPYDTLKRLVMGIYSRFQSSNISPDEYPPIRALAAFPFLSVQEFVERGLPESFISQTIFSNDLETPQLLRQKVLAAPVLNTSKEPITSTPSDRNTKKYHIFISYRREDSKWAAGRLADRLKPQFGDNKVFIDTENIRSGQRFLDVIKDHVQNSSVLLAIIGPQWLTISEDVSGRRRLDDEKDFVRYEIALALREKLRVIPICLDNTNLPQVNHLPDNLQELTELNAVNLRAEHFNRDVEMVISDIKKFLNI